MNTSQKIVIHAAGNYKQLKIEKFTPEVPQKDQILVRNKAVGINYADVCVRWGVYESAKKYVGWPITPGFEFSGIVEAIGNEVTDYNVGDEVFGVSRFNSYASYVIAPQYQIFKKPQNISFEQAAGIPAVYLTAYHALFQNIVIHPNSTILVHSAAGGVGSALVQMAKSQGHKIIGIVGNPNKKDFVLSLGADKVVSKREESWVKIAQQFSPNGYDVIMDANGYETLMDGYGLLAPMGKLVSYGFHTMLPKKGGRLNWFKLAYGFLKTPRFNPINMTSQNKSLVTFNLSFLFDKKAILKQGMEEVINWLENGEIHPPKVSLYPFADVAQAHKDIESGNTMGKLILTL